MLKGHMQRCTVSYFPYRLVMGNPGLVHGPDLEVAVHNVADPAKNRAKYWQDIRRFFTQILPRTNYSLF